VTMLNAPLRYTLAVLRFPKVINIEKYVGLFQEEVRSEYPHLSDQHNQGIEVVVAENGGAELKSISEKIWQFGTPSRDHALILGSEFLVLHAGRKYVGHADFIGRFKRAVQAICRVEGLATVVTALGWRYIDLVVPRADQGEKLAQYLRPWAMPTEDLDLTQGVDLVDSAYIAGFRTPHGVLRFQALRRPPVTLPPELDTAFVRENGWAEQRPEGEFAVLDLDHASVLASPLAIDPATAAEGLAKLREPAVELFYKAVTEHALEEWNRQA
jgi:uncharacterized protein (TIGR04255 family)